MINRRHNQAGGGATTNKHGLLFEQRVSLSTILGTSFEPELYLDGQNVYVVLEQNQQKIIGSFFKKYLFIKDFVAPNFPDAVLKRPHHKMAIAENTWSKTMEPDNVLILGNTVNIIEMKYQQVSGTVDEKLQTCEFKKNQYIKLLSTYAVNYIYFLSNWYMAPQYRDVLNYITNKGCFYFFPETPEGRKEIIDFFAPQVWRAIASAPDQQNPPLFPPQ